MWYVEGERGTVMFALLALTLPVSVYVNGTEAGSLDTHTDIWLIAAPTVLNLSHRTHKLNKCDQSAYLQFALLWMSLLLNTAAASAKLQLWHFPPTRLKRWKTTEQQLATDRYHGNVFNLVQEALGSLWSPSLCHFIPIQTQIHPRSTDKKTKQKPPQNTTAACFIHMGELKWWHAWKGSPPPLVCANVQLQGWHTVLEHEKLS